MDQNDAIEIVCDLDVDTIIERIEETSAIIEADKTESEEV